MAQIVKVANLSKNYQDLVAVDDVSFAVARGEIFGFLGPNGAGKSTTMCLLTGLYRPSSGSVLIDGNDLQKNLTEARKLIGYVPQELALYKALSSIDNLQLFGRLYGLTGRELSQRMDEVLELSGLTQWAKVPVEQYSGGMKRRLNLAIGIIHSPKVLLLDEPTVGVDPQSRNHIFDCIKALAGRGTSVIYTTHYMEEVENLCHNIAIMDKGRIIAMDSLENLLQVVNSGIIEIVTDNWIEDILPSYLGDYIQEFTATENILRVLRTTSTTQAVKEVGLFCAANSLEIRAIRTPEANLETVFLQLTGKRLRE